jgi:hypothetical protein
MLYATLPPAGGMTYSYQLLARQFANAYDFENHLIGHNGVVNLVYHGDGNRVSETVGTVTTNYLVDTQNPTGYAQVVDELQNGAVTRTYSYGLERSSETQPVNSTLTTTFYRIRRARLGSLPHQLCRRSDRQLRLRRFRQSDQPGRLNAQQLPLCWKFKRTSCD